MEEMSDDSNETDADDEYDGDDTTATLLLTSYEESTEVEDESTRVMEIEVGSTDGDIYQSTERFVINRH